MKGKVYGYSRVSTIDQNTETQEEALKAAGCDVVMVEKASAKDMNGRPKLEALKELLSAGDTLVVTKLDRLARSTADLLSIAQGLEDKGVKLRVLNVAGGELDTSTATGKLMLTMLGAVATFERELMLERQREGIEKAKTKGKYTGRKPTARMKAPEVYKLADQGKTREAIADALGIGVSTVYRLLSERKGEADGMVLTCTP